MCKHFLTDISISHGVNLARKSFILELQYFQNASDLEWNQSIQQKS